MKRKKQKCIEKQLRARENGKKKKVSMLQKKIIDSSTDDSKSFQNKH